MTCIDCYWLVKFPQTSHGPHDFPVKYQKVATESCLAVLARRTRRILQNPKSGTAEEGRLPAYWFVIRGPGYVAPQGWSSVEVRLKMTLSFQNLSNLSLQAAKPNGGQRGKAPAKAWAAALYEGWFDMDGLQRNVGAVFDPKPLPFCAASALLGRPFRRSQGAMGARTHTHTVNIQDLSTCPSKFGYATIIIYDPYPHEWLWCRGKHVTYNKPVGLKCCKLLFFWAPKK